MSVLTRNVGPDDHGELAVEALKVHFGGARKLVGRDPPRVHAVDGSVFPSIPATSVAFTIMANARRVATEAPLERP